MVEGGIRLVFQAASEGSSDLAFARLPQTHVACPHSKPTGRLETARVVGNTLELSMHERTGAWLLLFWPWGGRFKENKSTSISSGCRKGHRWLRLTLQGGTWDLRRLLKYYLCLSNKNWVRAEHVPKQKLLKRVPVESGEV